uniref:Ig-like domain-containing protein n=1 Tax=Schistosoma mansoni TaxID=6183 RepID=A0A5K4FEA5_SCHMA
MPGIIVNNSLGHVFNLSASNNIIPIHAIYCKPFIVQISFNGTMINTSIFNITPEDGKLEGSWKQYALTNNETGTVTHHCNFETLTGSDCKLSVVGSYQNSAGRCTYKRGIGDSSLNFLKSDSSYTLQCLDQSGYTEVSSILHNTASDQRNIFLENLHNSPLPEPDEEDRCPSEQDFIEVDGLTVTAIAEGSIHLLSWNKISEKFSECLSHYLLVRIHRRLKPKVIILSVMKYRVDGHLNNIITDISEDQNYIYKVKAYFKNSIKTQFSERVEIQTPMAVNHNCSCLTSDVHTNKTGIRVPALVMDRRAQIA